MKMKRIISMGLSVVAMTFLPGCANKGIVETNSNEVSTVSSNDKPYICLVTDVAGVKDEGFNQAAYEGLKKAEKELGCQVAYLESQEESDYQPNIEYFTAEAADMVVAVGYQMADAIKNAAEANHDEHYAIVDYTYSEPIPNVLSIEFEDQEPSFLVGYLAGKMTKTNKVGFVGGIQSLIIDAFEYGYRAGVECAAKELKKDIVVDVKYADSFSDSVKGKEIADEMYKNGSDIIFQAAGGTGKGVIESAKEHGKYVIGADRDQNYMAPENVLSSTMKYLDKSIYKLAEDIKNTKDVNTLTGKSELLGLKDGGVGIAPSTVNMVPESIMKDINVLQDKIIKSEIKPPYDKNSFEEYLKSLKNQ